MTIPTLGEYLAKHVTDTRSDGFSEFSDLVERMLSMPEPSDAGQKAMLRWLRVFGVAIVEGLNGEVAHGVEDDRAIEQMARAFGYVAHATIAGNARDDAPLDLLARILKREVGEGARLSAAASRRAAADMRLV